MTKSNQNLILSILRWGLLFVIFFLPLAVTPWTIYPFVFGKIVFLQATVELFLALFIVLIVGAPEYRPKFDTLSKLLLAYFAVSVLAGVLGVDSLRSFWGTEERGMGLITQLHAIVFFLMARSVFGEQKWKERAYFIAVLGGIALGIVALLRLWNILIFGVDLGFRLAGTLGNPIFLAAAFILYLPFALYLAFRKSGWRRWFAFLAAAFFIIMILATKTRGALIALAAGLVFSLVALVLTRISRRLKIAAVASGVFILAMALFLSLSKGPVSFQSIPALRRFSVTSLKEVTITTRFLGWQVALKGIAARPLLGWGQENFPIAFNQYYNPSLLRFSYYETWWDRPHNIVLETLIHSGVLGLISYLTLLGYAFYRLWRGALTGRIFSIGLLMYFIQNLFAFDSPASFFLFLFLLSGVNQRAEVGSSKMGEFKPEIRSPKSETNSKLKTQNSKFLLPILLLASGIMIYKLNWQPMVASDAMLQSTVYATDYSDVRSIPLFREALKLPTPYKEETRTQAAQIVVGVLIKKSIPPEQFQDYFDFARRALEANIARHPLHVYYHYLLARLYTEALNYDPSFNDEAEKEFEAAIALSPKRQQTWFGLAKLRVLQGRLPDAKEIYRKMVELEPEVGEAHWYYGAMLRETGDIVSADRELLEAARKKFIPHEVENRLILATLMAREKNYFGVQLYLEAALEAAPERADIHAQLAVVYKEIGRWEDAREEALLAAKLDPSYRDEAELFLKTMENK
ncbi:O-antigen ligase family protein [Candidatus Uhrbacteria bacterium]|nr:O-antigen ligase family protein [Candidatus Uhrbacteria bacterium]